MSALRLFFALIPESAPGAALVAEAAPLVERLAAQPVPAENLHATLCFVGAVESEKLDALRDCVARVRGSPATLCFDTFEIWEKPKILCATASSEGAAAPAAALALQLGAALVAGGFTPDIKPFRAHLTLGRKVSVAIATDFPQPIRDSLSLRADRFALMSSRRDAERSIYSVVDTWLLDARETQYFAEK